MLGEIMIEAKRRKAKESGKQRVFKSSVTSSHAEIFLMGLREVWQGKQSQSEC